MKYAQSYSPSANTIAEAVAEMVHEDREDQLIADLEHTIKTSVRRLTALRGDERIIKLLRLELDLPF